MKLSLQPPYRWKMFEIPQLKSYLGILHEDHDMWLLELQKQAVSWVEEKLQKTLLCNLRRLVHRNNCFVLPHGPVQEVVSVWYRKKKMDPSEYTLRPRGDTLEITVPFFWKSPTVEVLYEAGYGPRVEDIPICLQHAVLGTLNVLYEAGGDLEVLERYEAPWIHGQQIYKLHAA